MVLGSVLTQDKIDRTRSVVRALLSIGLEHGTPHSIARVLLDVFPNRKGHMSLQVYVPNSTAGTPLDRRGPPGTSICTENQPHRPMLRLCREENKNPPQIPARSQGMGL